MCHMSLKKHKQHEYCGGKGVIGFAASHFPSSQSLRLSFCQPLKSYLDSQNAFERNKWGQVVCDVGRHDT